jgi:hypothetical protein
MTRLEGIQQRFSIIEEPQVNLGYDPYKHIRGKELLMNPNPNIHIQEGKGIDQHSSNIYGINHPILYNQPTLQQFHIGNDIIEQRCGTGVSYQQPINNNLNPMINSQPIENIQINNNLQNEYRELQPQQIVLQQGGGSTITSNIQYPSVIGQTIHNPMTTDNYNNNHCSNSIPYQQNSSVEWKSDNEEYLSPEEDERILNEKIRQLDLNHKNIPHTLETYTNQNVEEAISSQVINIKENPIITSTINDVIHHKTT